MAWGPAVPALHRWSPASSPTRVHRHLGNGAQRAGLFALQLARPPPSPTGTRGGSLARCGRFSTSAAECLWRAPPSAPPPSPPRPQPPATQHPQPTTPRSTQRRQRAETDYMGGESIARASAPGAALPPAPASACGGADNRPTRFLPCTIILLAAVVTVTIWTGFIIIVRAPAQRTLTRFDIALLHRGRQPGVAAPGLVDGATLRQTALGVPGTSVQPWRGIRPCPQAPRRCWAALAGCTRCWPIQVLPCTSHPCGGAHAGQPDHCGRRCWSSGCCATTSRRCALSAWR